MRAVLGWLRGEVDHCGMTAIPTLEEKGRKRRNREQQKLANVKTPVYQLGMGRTGPLKPGAVKYATPAECLSLARDASLGVYDFPAEH